MSQIPKRLAKTLQNLIQTHTPLRYISPYLLKLEQAAGFDRDDNHKHPPSWLDVTNSIISLINLKDVASKLQGGEDLVKGLNAQLVSIIDQVSFPDPDAPVSPSHNSPSYGSPSGHWQGPIPPGPLAVIAELNLYSKSVVNEQFLAAINAIISQIAEKAASPAGA